MTSILITGDDEGNVNLKTNIANKIILYGALEQAKEAIANIGRVPQEQPKVIPITRPLPGHN